MKSALDTNNQNDKILRFTPRQLIRYHIEHPEIPITDNDIENLVLDYQVSTFNDADIDSNSNFSYMR
jgi:hypothetical protein